MSRYGDGSSIRSATCAECARDFEFPARPGRAPKLCPKCGESESAEVTERPRRATAKQPKKAKPRRAPKAAIVEAPATDLDAFEATLKQEIAELEAQIVARGELLEAIATYRTMTQPSADPAA